MRLVRLSVTDFRCVASAQVDLRPGLNVLHGPNDLGKSTLAAALRAGLLLLHGSSTGRRYVPWGTERKPRVQIIFDVDGRAWRVSKTFATGSGGASLLEWSNDGGHFTKAEEGRAVDGEVRKLLRWGIAAPGGKKRRSGLPSSFLSSVLLGEQALPYRVFDAALDGDDDETGRQRLTEALQALATDPLYQQVLDEAQTKVDLAFDSRGRPRAGKSSPFRGVADEIKRRHELVEELDGKVADADAVAARLAELDAVRDRTMVERAAAQEGLQHAERDHALGRERRALQQRVDEAQAQLDEITRNQEEMQRLTAQVVQLEAKLPEVEAEVEAAGARRRTREEEHSRARAALEAARAGGDAETRAAVADLQRRQAQLEARLAAVQTRVEAAQTWVRLVEDAAPRADRAQEARTALDEIERAAEQRAARREAIATELEATDAALRWQRFTLAEAAVRKLTAAAAEATRQRERAAELRAEAQGKLAALQARELPDADRRARLRKIHDELRLLRARLGGGISVKLRLAKSLEVRATLDGGATRTVGAQASIEAQRELELDLGRAGSIAIVGGEADARREAAEAQARYADIVVPVLRRCGVDDVDALEALVQEDARGREAVRALEAEADTLIRLAEAHDPAALEDARVRLERAEQALGDVDRAQVEPLAAEHDEDALRACREALEDERRALQRAIDAAATERSEAQAAVRVAQEQARAAARQRDEAAAKLGDDPEAARREADADALATRAEVDAVKQQLEQLATARGDGVREAQEACARAEADVAAAAAEEAEARAALDAIKGEHSGARAALAVRREQAQQHDPLAAAEAFARHSDALAALPQPQREVGDEDLAAARAQVEAAEAELDEALAEVRKQEGALQQVGGQVIRDRAEVAREALESARRRQAEVELDYEGWRLLRDALREAENDEGSHLGRALGREVGERFEALTEGRYGPVELGRDLQTTGIRSAHATRDVQTLSEGLKEQLATILRVSIAQHLGGLLVLDDHLAQTDPARAAWFKHLLRDAAEDIQIVVLTCRPADYFGPDDEAGVHAVDLTEVIRRI